jgi:hypothetical protein
MVEGSQIGPNPIEEYLNSNDDDFPIKDVLTRIMLPTIAKLARTGDIIAVNPSVPMNATTPPLTTSPATTPAAA